MKSLLEIVLLLLPRHISGQPFDAQERDGGIMDTSEQYQCYVFGQCQEYAVNFQSIGDAKSCHKFCSQNDDCKWWSWEPDHSQCMLFSNCTDIKHSKERPNSELCPDCISGQRMCPARECHSPQKCK